MKYLSLMSVCVMTALLFSCKTSETEKLDGTAEVTFQLSADGTHHRVKSDLAEDLVPDVNDFTVEVFKRENDRRKRLYLDTYLNSTEKHIRLNAGSYYMLAHYGDSLATGFGKPYFQAKSPFEISADQRHVSVSGVAKLHNVKIAVKYGEDLLRDYPDFLITLASDKEGSKGKLSYTKSETREGFIPAGNLTFTLFRNAEDLNQNADENGNIKVTAFTKTIAAEPNDFITLSVNTKPAEGKLSVNIEIDRETETVTDEVEISSTYVSTAAPVITLAEDLKSALEFFEGDDLTGALVSIRSTAGYSHVYLDFVSSYLESKGLNSGIDLMDMDENTADVVKGLGITATEMGPEVKFAAVDFSGVSQSLKYEAVPFDAEFKVRVVDNNGNETVSDPFSLKIKKWNASVNVSEANAFARSFRGVTMTSEDGDVSKFALQYRTGNGEWTMVKPESVDGRTLSFAKIGGLAPETAYQFRPVYNRSESLVDKDYVSVTTEAAAQVGNAGFEEWTTETLTVSINWSKNTFTRDWYEAYGESNEHWWAVTSKKSLPTSVNAISNYNVKTFPSVSYSADKCEGNYSAHIFSVNIGSMNTTDAILAGNKTYVGELFIGAADDSGNHSSDGHAFITRPDRCTFKYKYNPRDNEKFYVKIEIKDAAGNVLNSKEDINGPAASEWTEYTIPFDWSNLSVKPAMLTILFKSTSASSPAAKANQVLEVAGKEEAGHFGSSLRIDDIQMIYE